jgi:hypothetical protein
LPGQRGSLSRCRGQRGRPRCSGGCWRGAADVRVGRGRLARHRARSSVGLAVVRWPARRDRDEPQPGGCGWRGRGGLAGSGQWPGRGGLARSGQWPGRGGLAGNGRRVRREGARRHVSSSRSGECERPRNALGDRVRIRLRLDSFLPQATDISASCLVTQLSRGRRATFP